MRHVFMFCTGLPVVHALSALSGCSQVPLFLKSFITFLLFILILFTFKGPRWIGCFDSIRWRRVVPWSGIRAEALAVLITASEPQFIHLLNGDMMPALLRFVIGIRVNISKLVCTKKLPVNSNYCYNVVKPLLYLLQMVCSNINLLVLVCIFKKGPYP